MLETNWQQSKEDISTMANSFVIFQVNDLLQCYVDVNINRRCGGIVKCVNWTGSVASSMFIEDKLREDIKEKNK